MGQSTIFRTISLLFFFFTASVKGEVAFFGNSSHFDNIYSIIGFPAFCVITFSSFVCVFCGVGWWWSYLLIVWGSCTPSVPYKQNHIFLLEGEREGVTQLTLHSTIRWTDGWVVKAMTNWWASHSIHDSTINNKNTVLSPFYLYLINN
jgi:hypothetical protein